MRRSTAVLISALLAAGLLVSCSGCEWRDRLFSPSVPLNAITGHGGRPSWVVGNRGTIFSYRGGHWLRQASGTDVHLRSVSTPDGKTAWAVGEAGTVLVFRGGSWRKEPVFLYGTLRSVFALDAKHVWAVGDLGAVFFFDGTTWARQESSVGWALSGVTASGDGRAWAVGERGVIEYDGSWHQTLESTYPLTGVSGGAEPYAVGVDGRTRNVPVSKVLRLRGGTWEEVFNAGGVVMKGVYARGDRVWSTGGAYVYRYDGRWTERLVAELGDFSGVYGSGENAWLAGEVTGPRFIREGVVYSGEGTDWSPQLEGLTVDRL